MRKFVGDTIKVTASALAASAAIGNFAVGATAGAESQSLKAKPAAAYQAPGPKQSLESEARAFINDNLTPPHKNYSFQSYLAGGEHLKAKLQTENDFANTAYKALVWVYKTSQTLSQRSTEPVFKGTITENRKGIWSSTETVTLPTQPTTVRTLEVDGDVVTTSVVEREAGKWVLQPNLSGSFTGRTTADATIAETASLMIAGLEAPSSGRTFIVPVTG